MTKASHILSKSQNALVDLQRNEPENQNYRRDAGRNLMFLGQANLDRRDFAGALENLARAREIFESQAAANSQNIFARRKSASVYALTGDTETAFAAASDAAARPAHLRAARENYERELTVFGQLEASGALTEYDPNTSPKRKPLCKISNGKNNSHDSPRGLKNSTVPVQIKFL